LALLKHLRPIQDNQQRTFHSALLSYEPMQDGKNKEVQKSDVVSIIEKYK